MSEKEKKIAEGLAKLPESLAEKFAYGASCMRMGYDDGFADGIKQATQEKEENKDEP